MFANAVQIFLLKPENGDVYHPVAAPTKMNVKILGDAVNARIPNMYLYEIRNQI